MHPNNLKLNSAETEIQLNKKSKGGKEISPPFLFAGIVKIYIG